MFDKASPFHMCTVTPNLFWLVSINMKNQISLKNKMWNFPHLVWPPPPYGNKCGNFSRFWRVPLEVCKNQTSHTGLQRLSSAPSVSRGPAAGQSISPVLLDNNIYISHIFWPKFSANFPICVSRWTASHAQLLTAPGPLFKLRKFATLLLASDLRRRNASCCFT